MNRYRMFSLLLQEYRLYIPSPDFWKIVISIFNVNFEATREHFDEKR